jgi:hypothetical protein
VFIGKSLIDKFRMADKHPGGHLYRGGKRHRAAMQGKFTRKYGKRGGKKGKGGAYVYGATIGKVYRASHHGRNWNQKRR